MIMICIYFSKQFIWAAKPFYPLPTPPLLSSSPSIMVSLWDAIRQTDPQLWLCLTLQTRESNVVCQHGIITFISSWLDFNNIFNMLSLVAHFCTISAVGWLMLLIKRLANHSFLFILRTSSIWKCKTVFHVGIILPFFHYCKNNTDVVAS